ncbi:hypothetical protein LguiB_005691 [Lonicera macranthoides]
MLWRLKLLHVSSISIIKTPSSSSSSIYNHLSSPPILITFSTNQISTLLLPPSPPPPSHRPRKLSLTRGYRTTVLTPHIVQSTLLNCPSDLIALSFFFWCAKQPHYFHHPTAFDHMVTLLSRLTQHFKTPKSILKQLECLGNVTKPQTLLLLLRIYWRGGMYDMVFPVFEQMLDYGYTPNTYTLNIVMDVLFKIGRVDVALRVLKETQVPNFLTFSIAISNLCRLHDFITIPDVLRNMLRHGYYPDAHNFPMLLNCCCKSGKLAEALQLLALMITLGIPASVTVWSILIDGLLKSGRLLMAIDLLDKMVEAGYSPNVVTCTSLIKGFLESQMPGSAFHILSNLESMGYSPDLVLCNVLIDGLSKIGRYDDALDVFFSLPKRKLVPDSYTFCSIVSAVCLSRRFALLPLLVSGYIIQANLIVCNSILNYFCKAGYPSAAVEFYNDMIDRGFIPDMYSYVGLLSGLCGAGRIVEAVNVYHGLVKNHFNLDAYIHTVIMDGLIKSGNSHIAVRLFRKAVAEKYAPDVVAYTVAINGLLRAGRPWEAYSLYNEMKEVGVVPNKSTYNVMISGFCRERDVKMVKQILREMIDRGIELDCSTFDMIMSTFKSSHSHSIHHLFIEFLELGLISNKVLYALLVDGLTNAVDAHPSLKRNTGEILDVSLSSSEDLSDVAASLG